MNFLVIPVLLWLGRLIIAFPAITSVIKTVSLPKGRKLPLPLIIMTIHTLLACLIQASITLLEFSHINYHLFYHLYIVEEFVMDMLFYRELLKKTHAFKDQPSKRKIFLVAIVLFVAFAVINVLFINNLNEFPTYTFIVQSIVMIIVTSRYDYVRSFYEPVPVITTEEGPFKLYKGPVFWINKGKLIYFLSSFPIFVLYHTILHLEIRELAMLTWTIQNISLITLHIFMGIGFLKFKANPDDVLDMQGNIKKADDATKKG